MPFPLSHPAAVLPLRRFEFLNFSALLIGSVTPDLSYCFERYRLEAFAHTVRGCFGFSLPVGWLVVLVFQIVRGPLVNLLPAPHRQALLPACRKLDQPWFTAPLCVLIGAATHVLWDSFTHETGWFAERSTFLQRTLFTAGGVHFRMYRLLWHLSTWAGLLFLYRAYLHTLKRRTGSAQLFVAEERRRYALCGGILLLPLPGTVPLALLFCAKELSFAAAVPRCLRLWGALYLVVLSLLLVAIGAALKVKRGSPE